MKRKRLKFGQGLSFYVPPPYMKSGDELPRAKP